jgi:hypothetical protein
MTAAQHRIVTGRPLDPNQAVGEVSFYAEDGQPVEIGGGEATPTPAGTAAQLQAGTDTTARAWTAKAIHDEVARQIAAITPAAG